MAKERKRRMPAVERKRLQRKRDRALGWREINVKIAADQVEAVKDFCAALPPPAHPTDPRQLDLLASIDAEMEEDGKGE
jgi:hypothetical protein